MLKLNAIDRDQGQAVIDIAVHPDGMPDCLLGQKLTRFGYDATERRRDARIQGLLEQGPNAADDIRRRVGVAEDALDCLVRALDIWRVRRQPTLTGMGVGNDGGQRLIHFVGNRSRQLGEACRLARPRKSLLRRTQRLLRPNLVFNVQADHVPLDDDAFGVSHRPGARLNFADAVATDEPGRLRTEAQIDSGAQQAAVGRRQGYV